MEKDISSDNELVITFNKLADVWEGSFSDWANPQLTHINNHPSVKAMESLGEKALPMMFDRLKNIIFYIEPIRNIIYKEFDEEIEGDINIPDGEGKYGFLEKERVACTAWWKKHQEAKETIPPV